MAQSTSPNFPFHETNICTVTQVKWIKCSYTWTVCDFTYLRHVKENVTSPEFSSEEDDQFKWCLHLIPTDKMNSNFSIYLQFLQSAEQRFRAKIKCSILNSKGEETKECVKYIPFPGSRLTCPFYFETNPLLDPSNCMFPDDKLTIFCEVAVGFEFEHLCGHSNTVIKVPECRMLEGIGNLYENRIFSDVTLSVNGKEIKAHKAILAARSPVFKAMFEHDMEERKNNHVVIEDLSEESVQQMLHFIYTDKAPELGKMAYDLLAAADKYALDRLKVMCEEALLAKLSVETATEILIVAHLHSAESLKAEALQFFHAHAAEVMDTQGWKTKITSYPHLLVELCRASASCHKSVKPRKCEEE